MGSSFEHCIWQRDESVPTTATVSPPVSHRVHPTHTHACTVYPQECQYLPSACQLEQCPPQHPLFMHIATQGARKLHHPVPAGQTDGQASIHGATTLMQHLREHWCHRQIGGKRVLAHLTHTREHWCCPTCAGQTDGWISTLPDTSYTQSTTLQGGYLQTRQRDRAVPTAVPLTHTALYSKHLQNQCPIPPCASTFQKPPACAVPPTAQPLPHLEVFL